MTPDPLTSRPLSVKAPPSTALKNQLPTDLDDVIMTLLSLSPDPPGVSPEPQPVTSHAPSASFTYLCSHMAACSSLCCKHYSVFVLECVF